MARSKGVSRELPAIGTKLVGKFKGTSYKAKIVGDKTAPTGKAIEYAGAKYRTMTSAAKAIAKQSVNGWRFWKSE